MEVLPRVTPSGGRWLDWTQLPLEPGSPWPGAPGRVGDPAGRCLEAGPGAAPNLLLPQAPPQWLLVAGSADAAVHLSIQGWARAAWGMRTVRTCQSGPHRDPAEGPARSWGSWPSWPTSVWTGTAWRCCPPKSGL